MALLKAENKGFCIYLSLGDINEARQKCRKRPASSTALLMHLDGCGLPHWYQVPNYHCERTLSAQG